MRLFANIILSALTIFSFSQYCAAQQQFGIKIGMATANQSWDYSTAGLDLDNNSRAGLDIGVFYLMYDGESFDIIPEIRYIQKGTSADFINTNIGQIVTLEPRADYLTITPMIKKTVPIWINPYFLAGPRLDVLLGTNSEQFFDTFEKLRFLDFGVTLGAGFDFPFNDQFYFLTEFRYEPSFINAYQTDNLEVKNTAFSVLIGLAYTR